MADIHPIHDQKFEQKYTENISINNVNNFNNPEEQSVFSADLEVGKESWWHAPDKKLSIKNPETNEVSKYDLFPTGSTKNMLIKSMDLFCEYSQQDNPEITPDELAKIQEELSSTFGKVDYNDVVHTDQFGQKSQSARGQFNDVFQGLVAKYTNADSEGAETISPDEIYKMAEDLLKGNSARRIK